MVAKVARSLGISEAATNTYLGLLESMYLIQRLPSWGQGLLGRETRRDKVSLTDVGLAAAMLDFTADKALTSGGFEFYGSLVEQFVATELLKQREWSRQRFRVYHYRSRQAEVDCIVELADGSVIAIEVKSSSSLKEDSWRNMDILRRKLGERFLAGIVLYSGRQSQAVGDRMYVLPLRALWARA